MSIGFVSGPFGLVLGEILGGFWAKVLGESASGLGSKSLGLRLIRFRGCHGFHRTP